MKLVLLVLVVLATVLVECAFGGVINYNSIHGGKNLTDLKMQEDGAFTVGLVCGNYPDTKTSPLNFR
jgi:hypothetical protein